MGIFGLITKKELQAQLKAAVEKLPSWLYPTADAEKYSFPDMTVYSNQADLYRRLSWVLAAVMHVGQEASMSAFNVKKQRGEDWDDIPNHPFEKLMRHPNPLDSRHELIYGTVAMKKLTGNAYWWLNRSGPSAPPDELWLIPSHMIRPVPDERLYLKGYMYEPGNGMEILLEPWEVVHVKSFNPFSRFLGLSAIESLAVVAEGDMGMQAWNTKLFKENNARLPGMLMFATMIEDGQWDKIKSDTREAAKNRELLMLRGTGEGDVKWLQNAVSQKEMEFLGGRLANKEEIWSVLAPGLASMLAINVTEANAQAGRATFRERAVYPEMVVLAEKITHSILPAYGDDLMGEFDDIRYTDRALELQEQEMYARTHTVEEVRAMYYQDLPIGDERDKLFAEQITSESGGIQKKEVMDEPKEQEEPEVEEPVEAKSYREDMERFKRKAMKRVGEDVEFVSEWIPANVAGEIHAGLSGCKTKEDVRALFLKAQSVTETPAPVYDRGAMLILEAMRAEVEVIKGSKSNPVNVTVHNHPGEPPVVDTPDVVVNVPPQEVNVKVEPTPVTIENKVEVKDNRPEIGDDLVKAIKKAAKKK